MFLNYYMFYIKYNSLISCLALQNKSTGVIEDFMNDLCIVY